MAHHDLQLREVGGHDVDVARVAEVADGHGGPVRRRMDADRHVQLDALRVQRVVAAIVGGHADHERPHAQPPEAAVAHEVLEVAHRVHAGEDVRAGERNEAVRMALGQPGDQLVRDERLVHARELVEAGDQRTVDPRLVERRDHRLVVHRHAGRDRARTPPGRAPACRRPAGSPPSPSGSDARRAPSPRAPARSAPTCRSRAVSLMPPCAARRELTIRFNHRTLSFCCAMPRSSTAIR